MPLQLGDPRPFFFVKETTTMTGSDFVYPLSGRPADFKPGIAASIGVECNAANPAGDITVTYGYIDDDGETMICELAETIAMAGGAENILQALAMGDLVCECFTVTVPEDSVIDRLKVVLF